MIQANTTNMEVYMEEREIKVCAKKVLCELKVKREIDGLSVFVKSEIMEEYFRHNSNNVTVIGTVQWNKDMKLYTLPFESVTIPDMHYAPRLDLQGMNYLINREPRVINLSFLRLAGLSEGISLSFKGLYMRKDVESIRDDIKKYIAYFYSEYMSVCEFHIEIVTIS